MADQLVGVHNIMLFPALTGLRADRQRVFQRCITEPKQGRTGYQMWKAWAGTDSINHIPLLIGAGSWKRQSCPLAAPQAPNSLVSSSYGIQSDTVRPGGLQGVISRRKAPMPFGNR